MENKNQNDLSLIQKQKQQINKLKSIIMELYNIIKCSYDEGNLKLLNLIYGVITQLVNDVLNYEI